MAQTSGIGGLGGLILGGIAGTAAVLGGVVLFQLGVFSSGEPEGSRPPAGQAGTTQEGAGFTGDGDESGQPLQNNGLLQPAQTQADADTDADTDTAAAQDSTLDTATDTTVVDAPAADPEQVVVVEETVTDPAQSAPDEPVETDTVAVATPPATQPAAADTTPEVADQADTAVPDEAQETSEPAASQDAAAVAEPSPTPAQAEESFVLAPPELDLVRVDSEGSAVIAGRAQPGARVSVLLDGEVLEQLQVPGGGEFVSLTLIEPQGRAQVISLMAELDGQRSVSDASFILAPVSPVAAAPQSEPEPAEVAEAAPQDTTETTETALPDAGTVQEQPADTQVAAATPEVSTAPEQATAQEAPPDQEQAQAASDEADSAAADTALAVTEQEPNQPAAIDENAAPQILAQTDTAQTEPAQTDQEQPKPAQPEVTQAEATTATDSSSDSSKTPDQQEEPEVAQPRQQAVAVLRADENGVQVVQPAIPADPALSQEIALDSISYNGSGGVELSGRSRPGSRVRVYVDNAPIVELDASGDGRWSGRLEGVEPGIYTLRLDEIERASGGVVSRLETPFKREAPEALQQPDPDAAPDQPAPLVRAVTVQKGDTLWAISQQKYGSGFLYVRLFEANKNAIRNPDLIYPGQVFTIPE